MEPVTATTTRVRVGSWSWAGLLSWVLRFDAPFTVEGPPEFVDALDGFAGRIRDGDPRPFGLQRSPEKSGTGRRSASS